MRTLLPIFVLGLCASVPVSGQAIRFDSTATTTSAQCVSGKQCPLLVLPGTQVNFCQGTPSTVGGCLSSPATTYTSQAASVPCSTTAQLTPGVGGACLSTADAQGGYGAWLLPGSYSYYLRVPITAGGGTYGPYVLSIHGDSGGYTFDSLYSTLAQACTAAGSGTLAITRAWNATPSQTLACNVWFLGDGRIQTATSATVIFGGGFTCPTTQQCLDSSTNSGGSFAWTKKPPAVYPQWWGAKSDGVTDGAIPIRAAVATGMNVEFPQGAYKSSTSQTITTNTQHVSCVGPGLQGGGNTYLLFTGATDGFVIGDGISQIENVEIGNCNFVTSNAGAGKAINALGTATGIILNHLSFGVTGAGAWTNGIYAPTDFESNTIDRPYCYGVSCISLHGTSNANTIISPFIGGVFNIGIETVGAEDNYIIGGTVQSSCVGNALISTDGGLHIYGGHYENQCNTGNVIRAYPATGAAQSAIDIHGMELSGRAADSIRVASNSAVTISGLTGYQTASGCIVRIDGNSGGSAALVSLTGNLIENASTSGSSHALCIGTASSGVFAATVSGNVISTGLSGSGGGDAIVSRLTSQFTLLGNQVGSATFAVNIDAGSLLSSANNVFLVPGLGNICTGCTPSNMQTQTDNQYNTGSGGFHPVPNSYTTIVLNAVDGYTTQFLSFGRSTGATATAKSRWRISLGGDSESGGNAGSSLIITPIADDGVTLLPYLQLFRVLFGSGTCGGLAGSTSIFISTNGTGRCVPAY